MLAALNKYGECELIRMIPFIFHLQQVNIQILKCILKNYFYTPKLAANAPEISKKNSKKSKKENKSDSIGDPRFVLNKNN